MARELRKNGFLCDRSYLIGAGLFAICTLIGCQPDPVSQNDKASSAPAPSSASIKTAEFDPTKRSDPASEALNPAIETRPRVSSDGPTIREEPSQEKMLGALLEQAQSDETFIPPPIDEARVQALGIQKIAGRYIDLYTDIRDDGMDEYVAAFDLAVPQWAAYFNVDVPEPTDFHVRGSLIQDKDRFRDAKLLPVDIPPFPHGYQDRAELWVYLQPGDYFTRHLLLHEGTHAFMRRILHGSGPPWYMEGIAELLATHQWKDGKLQLGYRLKSSDEAPYWGRVKIVHDAFNAGRSLTLESVMQYGWRAHLETEPYGWCWAACDFFDGHPGYRPVFRQLPHQVTDRTITFSQKFIDQLPGNWNQVTEQWQLFTAEMDYGYDHERTAIDYLPTHPAAAAETVTIKADHGWQSSGLRVEADRSYRIEARGDFILADAPKPWRSEANGITIHYYKGHPLGILLGAVRDENSRLNGLTPLATPFVIGQDLVLRPKESGTLFLRINDAPADLANNRGELKVTITPIGSATSNGSANRR